MQKHSLAGQTFASRKMSGGGATSACPGGISLAVMTCCTVFITRCTASDINDC